MPTRRRSNGDGVSRTRVDGRREVAITTSAGRSWTPALRSGPDHPNNSQGKPTTMRQLIVPSVVSLLVLLGGCAAVQPFKVSHASSSPPEQIYNCAIGLATSFGYTVEQANKDSGFFKAERTERKGASSIHWGATLNEELTVLVLSLPDQQSTVQVTAASNYSGGRNMRMVDPTPESTAEAKKIIAACAK
jgi:hypothetical protein